MPVERALTNRMDMLAVNERINRLDHARIVECRGTRRRTAAS